ncbi:hypothetical protein J2W52_000144 [Rhizobium miluonense]|jgi:hypothetical protein|uniref:Uncharacterized protein n=1 Tax=Rhizobium miluonense TaxID=411945 RepID=A0ABU1SHS6_9HYPH|nr:hypothetical protein [Rhizobium miluonense]
MQGKRLSVSGPDPMRLKKNWRQIRGREHLAAAAVIASWRQRGVDFMHYSRTAAAWDGTGSLLIAALVALNIEEA